MSAARVVFAVSTVIVVCAAVAGVSAVFAVAVVGVVMGSHCWLGEGGAVYAAAVDKRFAVTLLVHVWVRQEVL